MIKGKQLFTFIEYYDQCCFLNFKCDHHSMLLLQVHWLIVLQGKWKVVFYRTSNKYEQNSIVHSLDSCLDFQISCSVACTTTVSLIP